MERGKFYDEGFERRVIERVGVDMTKAAAGEYGENGGRDWSGLAQTLVSIANLVSSFQEAGKASSRGRTAIGHGLGSLATGGIGGSLGYAGGGLLSDYLGMRDSKWRPAVQALTGLGGVYGGRELYETLTGLQ